MSDVKRYTPFDQWGQELTKCMEQDERGFYVRATDYDALATRLAEAVAIIREGRDDIAEILGQQSKAHRIAQYTADLARIDAFLRATDSAEAVQR